MRFLYLLFSLFFLLTNLDAGAQITLNPAVDTANNSANGEVVQTLINYLTARFDNKDARFYWLPAEAAQLKAYDLYEAHSLYRINFDDKIILGITQPVKGLYKVKVLFDYIGTDKVKTIFSINDYYLVNQNGSYKLTNALFNNMRLNDYKTINTAKSIIIFLYLIIINK